MLRYFAYFMLAVACYGEDAIRVTPCELAANPSAYRHKLIDVTGLFVRGFEQAVIKDTSCDSAWDLWVEYSSRDFGKSQRKEVEGFKRTLVKDKLFRALEDLFRPKGGQREVRLRLVARFFPKDAGLRLGFGHLGCCNLVFVQQVLEMDPPSK